MALKTKIRLEQVTGSMLQMRPPVFQSRPILQNFNPIDLSGSLGYFSQAIANINGSLDFGAQTPGVILHDSANVPTVLLAGAFDGIQSLKLAQRDGTTDDGMKLVFTSTGAHAASTILLNNNAGTGTDSVKVNSTAGGVDIDAKLVLALDGEGGIDIGKTADAAIDIDSTTLDIDASGAITIDGTSTVSIDGADDMNFTLTSGTDAEDLTIQLAGATDSSLFVLSSGTGTDAIDIDATAGSMLIGKSLADQKTLKIGKNGAVEMVFSPHDTPANEKISLINTAGTADEAILIDSVAGGLKLAAGNDSLHIDAAGTDADALNIDSGGGVDVDAAGLISLNSTAGSIEATVVDGQSVSLGLAGAAELLLSPHGTAASEKIALVNTSGDADDAILIDSVAGGLKLAAGNDSLHIDADGTDADALNIDSAGGMDVDVAGVLNMAAGDDSVISVGTAAKDLALTVSGGGAQVLSLNSAGTGTNAIDINATAGSVDVDALLKITLDAADDSNFNVAAAAKGLTLGVSGGGAQVLKLDSAGTGTNAIDINATAGGMDVDVAGAIAIDGVGLSLDSTAASNLTVTTGGAGAIDLAIGITGGGDSSLLLSSDGTGGDAISINSVAGGVDIRGNALVFSGSTATAINFMGDGSMTSGVGGSGMLFAASADYATLRGNTGMNAGTTVLGAINTLAGQVSGATATIFTGSNQSRAVDGDFTVAKLFGDNTNLEPTCGIAKAQVYVNGQLLVSSSIGGVNDYKITANNTIKFKFAIEPADLVMVIDRS